MSHAAFVHLRVHSAYSLSEGAIHIKELAKLCATESMPAVAITDINNLFGALEASTVLPDSGVQPIVGCELHLALPAAEGPGAQRVVTAPVVLLVQNDKGYRNLMKLVSRAHLDSDPAIGPHMPLAGLDGRTDGLILLTGGAAGPVGRLLRDGQKQAATDLLHEFSRLFP
ncbi:MAG TPA: PHP domain-containing protein, partial [Sphingomonadales bacterium]